MTWDTGISARPRAEIERPGMADEALDWLRETLGTVAPRDPYSRRLGERRHRLDLLAEILERDTFILVASWLRSEAVPAVKSKRAYADDIRMWAGVAYELGGHPKFFIGAITPGMVETWVSVQKSRGRSGQTINRRLSVLTALSNYATWKTKTPVASPVTQYDRVKVDQDDETTATPILEVEEFEKVVSFCRDAGETLAVVLLYTLAGRVTECCSADLKAVKKMGGEPCLDLRRKGGKGRIFPLPPRLYEMIKLTTAGRSHGPLLVSADGTPMDRHAVDRILNRAGKKAGVLPDRDLTPHVLRASKLTHMHDEGAKLEEIQEFAGHSRIETTMRYIRRRGGAEMRARHTKRAAEIYDHLLDRFLTPPS